MTGFPADPSKLEAGIAFGADLSVDPTTLTYTAFTTSVQPQILITRGRIGDSSATQPSTIDGTLLNPGGVFSPRNISGTHYGQLRRNTPMRVRVDPGSGMVTRGFGYIPDWQVRWDGPNIGDKIQVQPSGVMRRLGQGDGAFSALRRSILASSPVEYWPLEDSGGSTFAASANGGAPLAPGGALVFGAVTPPGGSAPLPDFSAPASASVLQSSGIRAISTTGYTVEFVVQTTSPVVTGSTPVRWTLASGTYTRARADILPSAGIGVTLISTGSSNLILSTATIVDDGKFHHVRIELSPSGADIAGSMWVDGTLASTGTATTATIGVVTTVRVNSPDGGTNIVSAGHVAIYDHTSVADHSGALAGYPGEAAATRFARLCTEGGIVSDVAASTTSEAMGVQLPATLLDLLRECEASDEATMLERTNGKLGFDPISIRYNQTAVMTVGYSLLADLLPNDDDRDTRNDVTASRVNGASARSELILGPLSVDLVTGVGDYPDNQSRSLYLDSQAASHASWLVNLGTVDEPRYVIGLNLRAHPEMVTQWLACDISDRIVVNNAPAMHLGPAPLDLIIEGYTELLDAVEWFVTIYCLPYKPYEVYQVQTGTGNRSRIPMPDATCTNDVQRSATDTSIAVTSTQVRWIDSATYGSQFPFQVLIAGEVMTVTAIAGTTLSQTLTVTRGFHGVSKILPANSTVQLWRAPVTAL